MKFVEKTLCWKKWRKFQSIVYVYTIPTAKNRKEKSYDGILKQ